MARSIRTSYESVVRPTLRQRLKLTLRAWIALRQCAMVEATYVEDGTVRVVFYPPYWEGVWEEEQHD